MDEEDEVLVELREDELVEGVVETEDVDVIADELLLEDTELDEEEDVVIIEDVLEAEELEVVELVVVLVVEPTKETLSRDCIFSVEE